MAAYVTDLFVFVYACQLAAHNMAIDLLHPRVPVGSIHGYQLVLGRARGEYIHTITY